MENFENAPRMELAPSPLAKRLLNTLPQRSGNEILDIGVREGNIVGEHSGDDGIFFAENGNKVTVVDLGESVIENVEKRAKKFGVDSDIEFMVGNPEKLDLPEGRFDAVFSLAGLDGTYIPDSLKEIHRVLKPEAKALILIYYKSGERLIQGDEKKLKEFILQSGLQIDDQQIRVIDQEKGLETIIFELHK
ncbi:MAG: class I SAM-dependent methyltransferase [Candidatus Kaiserbacteria bacterium]|nr:class I SAM-dependent methyltransferase [Candidatus Kaiserbacteria bacterium]